MRVPIPTSLTGFQWICRRPCTSVIPWLCVCSGMCEPCVYAGGGGFFSNAPHHWDRSVCSRIGKHYTSEKKTGGYRRAVPVRPNTPTSLYFTYHPPILFFPGPSTISTQAGAQTAKALRLGKMQTYPTPSGFGHRECSDGPVSVLFCSLDLQPVWLPKGENVKDPHGAPGHRILAGVPPAERRARRNSSSSAP